MHKHYRYIVINHPLCDICMNVHIYMNLYGYMYVGRHVCIYAQNDGYRQHCMNVCMCTHTYIYIDTCIQLQSLAICLSIKECISDHRYEKANKASK